MGRGLGIEGEQKRAEGNRTCVREREPLLVDLLVLLGAAARGVLPDLHGRARGGGRAPLYRRAKQAKPYDVASLCGNRSRVFKWAFYLSELNIDSRGVRGGATVEFGSNPREVAAERVKR